jgi:hypothetical protein
VVFGVAPSVTFTNLVQAIYRITIHIWNSKCHMGQHNTISPSKDKGKYLTSCTSMLSKSMDAIFDLNLFLYFVNFNVSIIIKLVDEGIGYSGGR